MEEEKVIKSEPNAKYGNELLLDNIDYIGQAVGDIITRLKGLEQRMDAVELMQDQLTSRSTTFLTTLLETEND